MDYDGIRPDLPRVKIGDSYFVAVPARENARVRIDCTHCALDHKDSWCDKVACVFGLSEDESKYPINVRTGEPEPTAPNCVYMTPLQIVSATLDDLL